jgi:hypothetical protein
MTFIVDGTNGLTFNNSTTQSSAGVVLQVVNASYGTQTTITTSTMTATGLTASITPKFSTSKILVLVDMQGVNSSASANGSNFSIYKNGSLLQQIAAFAGYGSSSGMDIGSVSANYLDSPATTSSTTYSIWFNRSAGAGTMSINNGTCNSAITLMEIAG